MKVKELINELKKVDQDAEIVIPIWCYYKSHPIAYSKVLNIQYMSNILEFRIYTSLPKKMFVGQRK